MKFPEFVAITCPEGLALRRIEIGKDYATYYRSAGEWECRAKFVNKKLLIHSNRQPHLKHLHLLELVQISKLKWKLCNKGYV